ncbi:MAG TPA: PIN domain-containing protein [Terriglobales bacterium]|nr:PIN domain-containing protein [Terriglobales bacterium]
MSAPDFLDTNILVYAYDAASPEKQRIAQALVRRAVAGEIVTSSQVLDEFAATLLHKVSPAVSPGEVSTILDALGPIKCIVTDSEMVHRAVEFRATYGIHFYDGLIVAAAERSGSSRIWSEHLNAGQKYFGVRVENPFT